MDFNEDMLQVFLIQEKFSVTLLLLDKCCINAYSGVQGQIAASTLSAATNRDRLKVREWKYNFHHQTNPDPWGVMSA